MRVFSLIVKYLFFFAVIGALIYGIAPPILLNMAKKNVSKDLDILVNYSINRPDYVKKCANAPAASAYAQPKALQLRFINDREYVVELICSLIEDTPVSLKAGTLPPLVTKEAGSSGFHLDFNQPTAHSIRLTSWQRHQDISFDGKKVTYEKLTAIPASNLPKSVCNGYGYQCCTADTEKGANGQFGGATDCPTSCFAECSPLPYILSFTADPYPQDKKVTMTGPTQIVSFSYVAEVAGSEIAKVDITFGDGQQETSTEATGVFTHTYSCASSCTYAVVVKATDTKGNVSVENDTAKLYIVK